MCKQLELVQQDALVCPQATSFLLQVKLLTMDGSFPGVEMATYVLALG